jgi:hypothetical protein
MRLVRADDHVVDMQIWEARLLLPSGNPGAFLAPAQLWTWREPLQLVHCRLVPRFFLRLLVVRSGLLLLPLDLLRLFLRPLLGDPGRLLERHLGKSCLRVRELRGCLPVAMLGL